MSIGRTFAASVMFAPGLDVADWEQRSAAGTVPSRWPYGLDRLRNHDVDLSVVPFGPISTDTHGDIAEVVFGFDERVARTLATSTSTSLTACGIIWLLTRPNGPRNFVSRVRTAIALRSFDLVWCYSSAMVVPLQRMLRLDSTKVRYIPLGIDAEYYGGAEYPKNLMVLSVGNDRSRDSETLYRALAIVHELHPSARIVVQANDETPAPSFVEKHTRFRDHAELRDYYSQASVVVIATRHNLYTSGSTVALEAQAMRRPVVISDTPGMADYVLDGETGFRVSAEDPVLLARAVGRLLNDRQFAESLGAMGRSKVLRDNTTDSMAEHLSQALSSIRQ